MLCTCSRPNIGPPLTDTCFGGRFTLFMSILNTLITRDCSISELCQRIHPILTPNEEYDFVVIGGGSGGSVVAGRLSEIKEWNVLLIEAGGDEPPASEVPSMDYSYLGNPIIDWNYKTEPEPVGCQGREEHRCTWPRGKVLGGTSVIHGMMYMRGLPKDFDAWEKEYGNDGWGYKEVFKQFLESEDNLQIGTLVNGDYHSKGGPMTTTRFSSQPDFAWDVLKAVEEIGYPVVNDLNGGKPVGFTVAQANIR